MRGECEMTVQEIIDELMEIEDKTRTVRVYIKSGGLRGFIDVSGVDISNVKANASRAVYIDAIEELEKQDA